jgi:hypothetical protein
MNRYTDLTPAVYDPMSMQEIMMAPMLKRKQHDQVSADLSALDAELAKIDPLDVHTEYAKAERAKLADQIQQQAETLASQGYNNNTASNLLKFNRQFQETISPTGSIGQINAAKKVHDQLYEDWMKTEEAKKAGPEIATQRWLEHRGRYDQDFKDNQKVKPIGQMVAPKFQDLDADIKEFMTGLGSETLGYITKNGYGFEAGPDGTIVMTTQTGKRVQSDNINQINQAVTRLADKWIRENAPGKEWADFTKTDQNYIIGQINAAAGAKRITKQDDSLTTSRNWKGNIKQKDPDAENIEGLNLDEVQLNSNKNLLEGLEGSIFGDSPTDIRTQFSDSYKTNITGGALSSKQKEEEKQKSINKVVEGKEYQLTFNALKRTNPEEFENIKYNSPEAIAKVKNYLNTYKDVSITNQLITPDVEQQYDYPFEGLTSTDFINKRTNTIKNRIHVGNAKLYDDETGKEIKLTQDQLKNVKYAGYIKPGSIVKMDNNNAKQKVSPDVINYFDEDGNPKKAYVTKDPKVFETPQFKSREIGVGIANIAKKRPAVWNTFKSESLEQLGFKDGQVKYEPELGAFQLKGKIQIGKDEYVDFGTNPETPAYFKTDEDIKEFILQAYQKAQ